MNKYVKIIVLIFAVILVAGCSKKKEEEKEEKKEVTVEEVAKQGKEKCVASSKLVYTQFKKDFKVEAKDAACYIIRSDDFGYASVVINDINNHVHSYVLFNDSETGLEKTSSTTSDSTLYDEGKCVNEDNMKALDKAKCLLARTAREHYDKYVKLSKEEAKSVYGTFAYVLDVSEFK